MATSAIASSSTGVATTKLRSKRGLKQPDDTTVLAPAINTDDPQKPPKPVAGKKRKQPDSEAPHHIDPKLVMDEEERKPKRRMSGHTGGGPGQPDGDRPSGDTWPTQGRPDLARGAQPMDTNETIEPAPAPHPTFDPSQPAVMQMIPPVAFTQNGGVQSAESQPLPSLAGPTRSLRSRSRPPSRGVGQQPRTGIDQTALNDQASQIAANPDDDAASPKENGGSRPTPYSRSPELRVSHKLAERKRRKEMKDLFDELRDQLPQDRGMKASKWEILSKAIDFIGHMKQSHTDMSREIEMLRHEVESFRQGMPFHPGGPHPVLYGQHVVTPFSGMHQAPPQSHPGAPQAPAHPPVSEGQTEPAQPSFTPGEGPSTNGVVASRTGTPSV